MAAFLLAQLEMADEILAKRRRVVGIYREGLADLEAAGRLRLPVVPPQCEHNGHMLYLLMPTEHERDALISHLDSAGVNAVFHYVPLHESPMGHRLGYRTGQLPVTENASRRLVRLPCYFELTEAQQSLVVAEVHRFCSRRTSTTAPAKGRATV